MMQLVSLCLLVLVADGESTRDHTPSDAIGSRGTEGSELPELEQAVQQPGHLTDGSQGNGDVTEHPGQLSGHENIPPTRPASSDVPGDIGDAKERASITVFRWLLVLAICVVIGLVCFWLGWILRDVKKTTLGGDGKTSQATSRAVRRGIGLFVFITCVWLVVGLSPILWYGNLAQSGLFGDSFGSVNAWFSGLALVLVVLAIYLQFIELKSTREAQQDQARHEQAAIDTAARTAKVQALTFLGEFHFRLMGRAADPETENKHKKEAEICLGRTVELLSELGEDVVSQDISIASEGELAARSLLALVENLERSQEEHNVESESNTPAQSMMGEVANDVREWGERYNHLPGANDVVQAVATFGEPTPGWKRSDPRTPANEWREWWLDHTRRISELREAAKAFAAQQESDG